MERNFNGELITRDIIVFSGFERAGRRHSGLRKLFNEEVPAVRPAPPDPALFPDRLARSAKYLIYLESCSKGVRGEGHACAWDCLRNMRQSFPDRCFVRCARYHLFQLPFVRSSATPDNACKSAFDMDGSVDRKRIMVLIESKLLAARFNLRAALLSCRIVSLSFLHRVIFHPSADGSR